MISVLQDFKLRGSSTTLRKPSVYLTRTDKNQRLLLGRSRFSVGSKSKAVPQFVAIFSALQSNYGSVLKRPCCLFLHPLNLLFAAIFGAFAELGKAPVSFVLYVCTSVRPPSAWNNSAPLDLFSIKFGISVFFKSVSKKFKFHYNLTRIAGNLYEGLCSFVVVYRWIILRVRSVSDKIVEKIKTHILCWITFFSKSVPFQRQCEKIWQSQRGHRWQ